MFWKGLWLLWVPESINKLIILNFRSLENLERSVNLPSRSFYTLRQCHKWRSRWKSFCTNKIATAMHWYMQLLHILITPDTFGLVTNANVTITLLPPKFLTQVAKFRPGTRRVFSVANRKMTMSFPSSPKLRLPALQHSYRWYFFSKPFI